MVSTIRQIVISLIVLPLVAACSNSQLWQVEKRNIPLSFQDGDIAFRRGVGVVSQAVLMSNQRGVFSHVGVVVQVEGRWMVIHEVPYEGKTQADDKIYCEEVGDFFNTKRAASGAIYRLRGLDSTHRSVVCGYLLRQLECDLPFDHDYDLTDSTRQYCSELVWRSYLEVGVDLSQGRRTDVSIPLFAGAHITPADIEVNENLELLHRF